jgi:hypothetical protein
MDATAVHDAATTPGREGEPPKLLRRIGSTTYEVAIHHSKTGKETMAGIIRRIIEREADGGDGTQTARAKVPQARTAAGKRRP